MARITFGLEDGDTFGSETMMWTTPTDPRRALVFCDAWSMNGSPDAMRRMAAACIEAADKADAALAKAKAAAIE